MFLDKGQTSSLNIDFGVGAPYTIKRVSGDTSEASIEGNKVKVTSFEYGDTFYKIYDKRGSATSFQVETPQKYETENVN